MIHQIATEVLDHLIAGIISIDFVDLRELADPDDAVSRRDFIFYMTLNILKKTILISETGQGINLALLVVIPDRAAKILRLPLFITDHNSPTRTDVIFAVFSSGAVLHVMCSGSSAEDILDAVMKDPSILRMDVLFPDVTRRNHVFTGQIVRLYQRL